ncbi:hypothetical protein P3T23_008927 [Paraburkholderia sp. GAS448]|uniref:DUF3717 domain-containing protein n=1 Tax=Paraburkholderia sp. GAS448 TaxID=3035136 RepID=UPI003D1A0A17
MNEQSAVALSGNVVSVTLVQIERALCYWRRETLRDATSDKRAAGTFLLELEELYRSLIAAHRGAVLIAQLAPLERRALHLWWQTLRDEE